MAGAVPQQGSAPSPTECTTIFAYVIKRLLQGFFAVFILTIMIFVLARVTGDPLELFLPMDATPELKEAIARSLGLDRPWSEQLVTYFVGLLNGDFGLSIRYRVPALDLFLERLPATLLLMVPAFLAAKIIGVVAGVIAATRRGTVFAGFLSFFSVLGLAVPTFWVAVMLMLVFSVQLGWLPAARIGGPESYILPFITLTIPSIAETMRLTRSNMMEQSRKEYVKLARLKGVSETSVVWKHSLKNSLTAVVAASGSTLALLLTGSILIENVFAWPGTGRLLYEAISSRDYPVVQALIILQGLFLVIANLSADLLQAWIDPRIRVR